MNYFPSELLPSELIRVVETRFLDVVALTSVWDFLIPQNLVAACSHGTNSGNKPRNLRLVIILCANEVGLDFCFISLFVKVCSLSFDSAKTALFIPVNCVQPKTIKINGRWFQVKPL